MNALQRANEARDKARALKKKKKAYAGPEIDIQQAVELHAASRGVHVIHIPDHAWAHVSGKYIASKPPKEFAKWFTHAFNGIPDIIAWYKGKSWCAELKNGKGKLSQAQVKKCLTMGAQVFYNKEDAIAALNKWIDEVDK